MHVADLKLKCWDKHFCLACLHGVCVFKQCCIDRNRKKQAASSQGKCNFEITFLKHRHTTRTCIPYTLELYIIVSQKIVWSVQPTNYLTLCPTTQQNTNTDYWNVAIKARPTTQQIIEVAMSSFLYNPNVMSNLRIILYMHYAIMIQSPNKVHI